MTQAEKNKKIIENILRRSNTIMTILEALERYSKQDSTFKNYYLAAGCINQTILNDFHGFNLDFGIEDYDIVYYEEDTSYEKEDQRIKAIKKKLMNLKDISLDIKNQKRVPIWYYEKFHKKKKDYTNVEDAISSWTSTITCIGVRLEEGKMIINSPYNLDDLINMIIRPVKKETTRLHYYAKAKKWHQKWPKLEIISWSKEK